MKQSSNRGTVFQKIRYMVLLLFCAGSLMAADAYGNSATLSSENGWLSWLAGLMAVLAIIEAIIIYRMGGSCSKSESGGCLWLEMAAQGFADAVVAVDEHKNISVANSSAMKLTNGTDVCGRSFCEVFQLLTSSGDNCCADLLNRTFNSCEESSDKVVIICPEGREVYIDCVVRPVLSRGGHVAGAVITMRDEGERMALEDQLRQAHKMESVGRLAGGIAHDFNNMIGAISGTAEVMLLQIDEDSSLNRYAKRILATATKAGDLTHRLLAFSRKGSGNSSTAFSLEAVVREAVEIIERSIDPRVEIVGDFSLHNAVVVGDPSAIENVVINLCLNASDAMPTGGTLHISTELSALPAEYITPNTPEIDYVCLRVSDTGSGISDEQLMRIFEPFYTTKETGKGSGLGLATVKNTIEEHNGVVTVSSDLGHGTMFCLYLPLVRGKAPDRVEAHQSTAIIRKGEGTVLLVDDEEFMRDAGKLMLESLGYNVVLAEDGQKAVTMYLEAEGQIDAILMDMVMPRMNGREAFERIISYDPQAKVIISSGFARDTGISTLLSQGLKAFVKKPYRQTEIAEVLEEVLKEE